MGAQYDTSISGKVQGDGNQTISLVSTTAGYQALACTRHQIAIVPGTATSGTVAVKVKPFGQSSFEALTRNGSAVVIDIAALETITEIPGRVEGWRLDPTSVNGTYGAAITGWGG